jgi:hypothetical protein
MIKYDKKGPKYLGPFYVVTSLQLVVVLSPIR